MFSKSSFVAAVALSLQAVNAQVVAPAPISSVGAGGNGINCGACYVAVEYIDVVFGTETITNMPTQTVAVVNGLNSTFTTVIPAATTVVSQALNGGEFTINPNGGGGAAASTTVFDAGQSTLVIGGVTVTSPNAVEIITNYNIVSQTFTNGQCSTVAIASPTNFAVTLVPGANQASFAASVESAFIATLGLPQCSPGGGSGSTISAIPGVSGSGTATVTVTSSRSPSPVMASSRSTVVPTSIASSLMVTGASSTPLQTITPIGGLPSSASYITLPANGTSTYYGGGNSNPSQATGGVAATPTIMHGAAAKAPAGVFAALVVAVMALLA